MTFPVALYGSPSHSLWRFDNAFFVAFCELNMSSLSKILVVICVAGAGIVHAQTAEMPTPASFNLGDTWEWRQVDNRTKVEEGKQSRTVVKVDGIMRFSNGSSTSQISSSFLGEPAAKPWRVWPLEVGKKWVSEETWTRSDGVKGSTKQDAEVVGYEEVITPAGKYMAFKIEYKGFYESSRGRGKQNDTYWYAPDVFADVKKIRDDGYNMYTRELTAYKRGAP
jgi:hypothetical protein